MVSLCQHEVVANRFASTAWRNNNLYDGTLPYGTSRSYPALLYPVSRHPLPPPFSRNCGGWRMYHRWQGMASEIARQ